jgi:hypothetical protein
VKSFITSLVIAAILITGGIIYTTQLSKKSNNLMQIIDDIEICINNDDFKTATEHIEKLSNEISDFEPFFLATGDHAEIDNIEINISELMSLTEGELKSQALAKVYVIKFLFKHLPQNTFLSFENIL